jgi:hypothetical protein
VETERTGVWGCPSASVNGYGIAVDIARELVTGLIIVTYVSLKNCGQNPAFGLNFSWKLNGGGGGEIEDFISVLSHGTGKIFGKSGRICEQEFGLKLGIKRVKHIDLSVKLTSIFTK